jgi:hypothetical protein
MEIHDQYNHGYMSGVKLGNYSRQASHIYKLNKRSQSSNEVKLLYYCSFVAQQPYCGLRAPHFEVP